MSHSDNNVVKYEVRDDIAIVTINRPEVRNAINGDVSQALSNIFCEIENDSNIKCSILTGSGSSFCSGADLKAIESAAMEKKPNNIIIKNGGFGGLVKLARKKPLIAAVNGPAIAGGFEIVLACDLVVAMVTASFGLPEVKRSLIASAGALFRLPRLVGQNIAMEMILTGEPITAKYAQQIGIVNKLADNHTQLMESSILLAKTIAANAPLSVQASRSLVSLAFNSDDNEIWSACFKEAALVSNSLDAIEGRRAFIEKRPPNWKGL